MATTISKPSRRSHLPRRIRSREAPYLGSGLIQSRPLLLSLYIERLEVTLPLGLHIRAASVIASAVQRGATSTSVRASSSG
jgi:hypothetical protein